VNPLAKPYWKEWEKKKKAAEYSTEELDER